MTPCIWLRTTHPCNPPNYGLWVNLHFFMMCIYKHCFPPMLLVFAMKCCTKMPCPLPHNHYCCLLPSPICLPQLLICTCLISSPIACPPSSVICWCLLRFFIFLFLLYATFLCDSILASLCTYFSLYLFCVIITVIRDSLQCSLRVCEQSNSWHDSLQTYITVIGQFPVAHVNVQRSCSPLVYTSGS